MNEDSVGIRTRGGTGMEKGTGQYTAKDFQLEVLAKLSEMQSLSESQEQSWNQKLEAIKEQRVLRFDSRALIALGAIALSVAGYVIEDARNTARQDSEIEATRTRVERLEQIAATNTEARIRTEVQLGQLREGQSEIKALIEGHELAAKKPIAQE